MSNDHNANGILKSVKIVDAIDDETSLSSALEEDYELIKLIREREHQKEIEIDIDDL